jgi:hypothetical protein
MRITVRARHARILRTSSMQLRKLASVSSGFIHSHLSIATCLKHALLWYAVCLTLCLAALISTMGVVECARLNFAALKLMCAFNYAKFCACAGFRQQASIQSAWLTASSYRRTGQEGRQAHIVRLTYEMLYLATVVRPN